LKLPFFFGKAGLAVFTSARSDLSVFVTGLITGVISLGAYETKLVSTGVSSGAALSFRRIFSAFTF